MLISIIIGVLYLIIYYGGIFLFGPMLFGNFPAIDDDINSRDNKKDDTEIF